MMLLLGNGIFAQEEVISPLLTNPSLLKEGVKLKTGNNGLDSTFVYMMDTIDVPVWDDFSINKFEQYSANYTDGNVTSQWYYRLMNEFNTIPEPSTAQYCDSSHSHYITVNVDAGVPTSTTTYFGTEVNIWVNDLNSYPITGQLRTLYSECYIIIDSIIDLVPLSKDTIWYTGAPNQDPDFVQDSIHLFTVDVVDPNRIWIDNQACHNYRFAVDPWSLGVATFDGVDSTGMPYDFGNSSAHGVADYLTSKHINLFGKTDVYLTFLYQAEGYGNMPEAEDSLIVEFWNADSLKWYASQWFSNGGTSVSPDVWDTAHIAVPFLFLRDGFRFRFKNYASISGALDHWHIDYVNLKDNDLPTISNFGDLAIAYPINTLLKDYTRVPWDHYKNSTASDKMLDSLWIFTYNSDATETNYADGIFEVKYEGVIQSGTPYVIGNTTVNWNLGLDTLYVPVASNYNFDQGVLTAPHPQATFDVKLNIGEAGGASSNIYEVNDTTYYQQIFSNYYAYDDGSAEVAYGISGGHANLAYKFTAYEADTLTGIAMSFVASVNDLSNKEFLITIWDDNGGEPGNIIYQDDYFNTNTPVYGGGKNGFHYYEFQDGQGVVVGETFYIGMEQIEEDPLNIGMDMNIDNSDKIFFINTSGVWVNTANQASLLMRPVFSTALNYTLSQNEAETLHENIMIYPNPTNSLVNVNGIMLDTYTIALYDISGRLVLRVLTESQFDVSDLLKGIYLIDIRDQNENSIYTDKLIIE